MTMSTWDNQELRNKYPQCATLGEIIAALEQDFSERGEVICEIRVNGLVLEEADEEKFRSNPADGIEALAIATNRPSQLINDALESAVTFLPQIEQDCVWASEALRGADSVSARRSFVEILDSCQWLIDTIMHVRGAASGIGQPVAKPERWFAAEQLVSRVVTEITEAFTKTDLVLVADILEYELPPALNLWLETLKEEKALRA